MKLFRTNYKKETDESLMQKIAKGDSYAFEVLYDRYSVHLVNYFYKMLWQDREKAEDFMQDLFTKIVQKPEAFDTSRRFKTWLFSIANNMCKNEYRKQEVRKNTSNGLDEQIGIKDLGNLQQDKQVDINFFSEALDRELEKLDAKHKTTFILRFKMNLSIKEIADALDTSPGTVKSRIFYTLKKLSANLEEFNPLKKEVINE